MQEAVVSDPGEEEIDVAVGIEISRGNPQAGVIVRQPEGSRYILEAAVSLVQKQGVAHSLGSDDGGGQEEVELAITVGVEGGDGRTEACAGSAEHRQRAREVGRFDPPLAFGSLTFMGLAASKLERDRSASPVGSG